MPPSLRAEARSRRRSLAAHVHDAERRVTAYVLGGPHTSPALARLAVVATEVFNNLAEHDPLDALFRTPDPLRNTDIRVRLTRILTRCPDILAHIAAAKALAALYPDVAAVSREALHLVATRHAVERNRPPPPEHDLLTLWALCDLLDEEELARGAAAPSYATFDSRIKRRLAHETRQATTTPTPLDPIVYTSLSDAIQFTTACCI